MSQKTGGIGIAIENNCAIEFIDGRFYRVISSKALIDGDREVKIEWIKGA
jgi:hypothetical protein